jgi:phage N-6-adenine-methyltransferase
MAQLELVIRNEDPDALAIGELYRKARASVADSVRYLIEAGQRLLEKKTSLARGEWMPWLEANAALLNMDISCTPQRLMNAAVKFGAGAEYDDQRVIEISRAIWGHNVRGTQGTGRYEWFTPAEYIPLVRAVLGTIDLDPATHIEAQKTVQATTFFTKEQDGLQQEWHGNVWLNPPYAWPLIEDFVQKLLDERAAGRVTAAIMLTHNYTSSAWFQDALAVTDAICFTRGRIGFRELDNDKKPGVPTQGQAFFYFGGEVDKFLRIFCPIGAASRWQSNA